MFELQERQLVYLGCQTFFFFFVQVLGVACRQWGPLSDGRNCLLFSIRAGFHRDSFLFLIYWPFCFNFLFSYAERAEGNQAGRWGTLASAAVKVSRDT